MNEDVLLSKNCLNCGNQLKGPYCHTCGQKDLGKIDRSFRFVIAQFLSAMYFVDGKFIKSFRYFITKPGFLTREFIEGKRVKYISPISLFLIINLLFFLFSTASDFNLALIDQVTLQPYSSWAKELVMSTVKDREITFSEYSTEYNLQSASLSKSLIILNIPVFALLILLINMRKKQFFYIDHFIYATHIFAFVLLIYTIIFPIGIHLNSMFSDGLNENASDIPFVILQITMILIYMIYIYVSFKKTYGTNRFETLLVAFYLFGAYLLVSVYYRFTLFLIVWMMV